MEMESGNGKTRKVVVGGSWVGNNLLYFMPIRLTPKLRVIDQRTHPAERQGCTASRNPWHFSFAFTS